MVWEMKPWFTNNLQTCSFPRLDPQISCQSRGGHDPVHSRKAVSRAFFIMMVIYGNAYCHDDNDYDADLYYFYSASVNTITLWYPLVI